MKTICFVAGTSGGHIIPCLTLARQALKAEPPFALKILFFASGSALDKYIINNPVVNQNVILPLIKFPYKKIYLYPVFGAQLVWTLIKSFYWLAKTKPERVVTTGGYIAIPVVWAARLLRIPVTLWELNVIPGKTIKFLAPLATQINICFVQTAKNLPKYTCTLKPYPVRFSEQDKIFQQKALEKLELTSDKNRKTIFILGGSQGSQELNLLIKKCVEQTPELANRIQVIHQTGANPRSSRAPATGGCIEGWQDWYRKHNIPALVFAYRDDIATLMCAADLVISRAGAGALAEIIFFEKPAIIIPLRMAGDNHQVHNAQAAAQQYNFLRVSTLEQAQTLVTEHLSQP